MIRFVVALFAFAVLLCGWIVYDPFGDDAAGGGDAVSEVALPDAEDVPDVTRDATEAAVLPDAGVVPAQAQGIAIARQAAELDRIVDDILDGLGFSGATGEDAMRVASDGAISGNWSATGAVAEPGIARIVADGLTGGWSDEEIDVVVQEADPSVPRALRGTDGRIDTDAILANVIVQARLRVDGAAAPAPVAATEHVVAAGDSLAGIAQAHFGDMATFSAILEANAGTLGSERALMPGQRLTLPAR